MKLKDYLGKINDEHEKAVAADSPLGACIVPDGNGGQTCMDNIDEGTCKTLNGVFLGGSCGAFAEFVKNIE